MEETQTAEPTGQDIGEMLSPDNFPIDIDEKDDNVVVSEPGEHPQENAEPEKEQPEGDSEGQTKDVVTSDAYELKLSDGTDAKVTLDELKSGYLRQSDYTKKTLETKHKTEELQQGYTDLETNLLSGMQRLLQKFDPAAPLMRQREFLINGINEAYRDGDTVESNSKRLDLSELEAQINAINQEKDLIFKAGNLQNEQRSNRSMEAERAKLLEFMPELAEPEKAKMFRESAYNALKHVGYSDQEMEGLQNNPDAKQAILSHLAGLYLQMKDATPQVAQVLKDKIVTPRTSSAPSVRNQSTILERLNKNPNDERAIGELLAPR